jgi:chromosome segregation protein
LTLASYHGTLEDRLEQLRLMPELLAQAGLAEAHAVSDQQREKIQQMETRIVEIRTERDMKRDTLGQARLELAERRQKVEVLDRGLGEMERRRLQLSELLIQRRTEIEAWTEQTAQLERESTEQRARAAQIAETFSVAQEQVEAVRVGLVDVERGINALESAQVSVRQESDVSRSQLGTSEIKLAENRQRVLFLVEEVTREFHTNVGEIDWRQQLWHADDEPEGVKVLDLDEDGAMTKSTLQKPQPANFGGVAEHHDGPAEAGFQRALGAETAQIFVRIIHI